MLYDLDFTKLNGKSLHNFYREQFNLYFDSASPPDQTIKNVTLFARLIREQDQKTAAEIVDYACEHWESLRRSCGIDSSYPLPGIIYGFRFKIMTLLGKEKTKDLVYEEPKEVKHKSVDAADIF